MAPPNTDAAVHQHVSPKLHIFTLLLSVNIVYQYSKTRSKVIRNSMGGITAWSHQSLIHRAWPINNYKVNMSWKLHLRKVVPHAL